MINFIWQLLFPSSFSPFPHSVCFLLLNWTLLITFAVICCWEASHMQREEITQSCDHLEARRSIEGHRRTCPSYFQSPASHSASCLCLCWLLIVSVKFVSSSQRNPNWQTIGNVRAVFAFLPSVEKDSWCSVFVSWDSRLSLNILWRTVQKRETTVWSVLGDVMKHICHLELDCTSWWARDMGLPSII